LIIRGGGKEGNFGIVINGNVHTICIYFSLNLILGFPDGQGNHDTFAYANQAIDKTTCKNDSSSCSVGAGACLFETR
jgi:hypothetical protein